MAPNLRSVVAQVGFRQAASRRFSSSPPGSRNGNVLRVIPHRFVIVDVVKNVSLRRETFRGEFGPIGGAV